MHQMIAFCQHGDSIWNSGLTSVMVKGKRKKFSAALKYLYCLTSVVTWDNNLHILMKFCCIHHQFLQDCSKCSFWLREIEAMKDKIFRKSSTSLICCFSFVDAIGVIHFQQKHQICCYNSYCRLDVLQSHIDSFKVLSLADFAQEGTCCQFSKEFGNIISLGWVTIGTMFSIGWCTEDRIYRCILLSFNSCCHFKFVYDRLLPIRWLTQKIGPLALWMQQFQIHRIYLQTRLVFWEDL